ncbi:MAG: hypothetical protein HQK65_00125 [Desulfamplus sp.]|nr:hypothetical protein [Desulfamplus sp.]
MSGKILFSACDAGSANYLTPILKQLSLPFTVFAQGPAASIFKNEGIVYEPAPSCTWGNLDHVGENLLTRENFCYVIVGTSWGPTVDKTVTLAAQKYHVPSIAIVEHWSLYRERFSRLENGNILEPDLFLPDKIWVNDEIAKRQAIEAGLADSMITIAGQPFLEYQFQQLSRQNKSKRNRQIVFISERIRDDFVDGSDTGLQFDEYVVLEWLLETVDFETYELLVKLHPQENINKYDSWLQEKTKKTVIVVKEADVFNLICNSQKVVGMGSMLLLEAALIRDDVLSVMPDCAPEVFIGNNVGATTFIATKEELMLALKENPAVLGKSEYGKRFLGSTERIISKIKQLVLTEI